jgi:beta-glucosidase/6-phospho-beta-glucosidase/beta-galactosidase
MRKELLDRIAQMLNHTMNRINNAKQKEIHHVQNPLKYKYDSKWLSKKIIQVYLHFSKFDEFVEAVSKESTFDKHVCLLDTIARVSDS